MPYPQANAETGAARMEATRREAAVRFNVIFIGKTPFVKVLVICVGWMPEGACVLVGEEKIDFQNPAKSWLKRQKKSSREVPPRQNHAILLMLLKIDARRGSA
jgi:hypothetical protein